jgi:hypothetical protein
VVHCEHATVNYDCDASGGSYCIKPNASAPDALVEQTESWDAVQGNLSVANFRDYFKYVRGEKDRPLILLEDTSSFVSLMSLIYVSAVRLLSTLVVCYALVHLMTESACRNSVTCIPPHDSVAVSSGHHPHD